MAAVIHRCLDSDPASRPPSMAAVEEALTATEESPTPAAAVHRSASSDEFEYSARRTCRDLARRLADALCADAQPVADESGSAWVSTHKNARGLWSRDLYVGSGGALLAWPNSWPASPCPTTELCNAATGRVVVLARPAVVPGVCGGGNRTPHPSDPSTRSRRPRTGPGLAGKALVALLRRSSPLAMPASFLDAQRTRRPGVLIAEPGAVSRGTQARGRLSCRPRRRRP
jgi:hypothetical protein